MKLNMKKSLFISMAALGLFAAAGSTTANAKKKSYPTTKVNRVLKTNPYDRNVVFTGTNAMYNKMGTLKGARVVATKSTIKGLINAHQSKNNLRAYRYGVTSKGSVYYKVVSFDGQYRGWVYGGKSTENFAGGIKPTTTFTEGTLSQSQKDTIYRITTPGIANDGKSATYMDPMYTQYKLNHDDRQVDNTSNYGPARFRLERIGTRTQEGDTWVYIVATDPAYTVANGWIKLAGLTATGTVTNQ
jgi:hypothetical protein